MVSEHIPLSPSHSGRMSRRTLVGGTVKLAYALPLITASFRLTELASSAERLFISGGGIEELPTCTPTPTQPPGGGEETSTPTPPGGGGETPTPKPGSSPTPTPEGEEQETRTPPVKDTDDSDDLDDDMRDKGIKMVSPHRKNRVKPKTQDGASYAATSADGSSSDSLRG